MARKTWVEQIADVSFNYKYTVFNAVAVLFTSGIQQITTLVTFKCPCVDPIQLPENCKNTTEHRSIRCMTLLNYFYGMSFIIAPAVGFFVFGLVLKQKLWKAVTGHRYKDKTEKLERSKYYGTILTAMIKSLIYPASWISAALLDGDFLACALTSMPYDLQNSYSSCWNVSLLIMSTLEVYGYLLNGLKENLSAVFHTSVLFRQLHVLYKIFNFLVSKIALIQCFFKNSFLFVLREEALTRIL